MAPTRAAISKALMAARSAGDHANWWGRSWAFHRALICHLPIRITAAIQRERRPFHGQVREWEKKQKHQKGGPAKGLACCAQARPWTQVTTQIQGQCISLELVTRVLNPGNSLGKSRASPLCQCFCSIAKFVSFESHRRKIGKIHGAT